MQMPVRLLSILLLAITSVVAADTVELKPEDLYKQASGAVMTLVTERKDGTTVTGSAFLSQKGGLAITAWHVVRNAKKVTARFANTEEFEVSGLVDRDPKRDVALLRVKVFGRPLLPAEPSDPPVGAKAYVIGAPSGLEFSISDGLVSQIRTVEGVKVFQYSCPTSPGNSGGPLLNSQGKAIGVVSFQFREGQNLNFAIPISYALGLDNSLPTQPWDTVKDSDAEAFLPGKKEGVPARPEIKLPPVRPGTLELNVPKKEPYTLRLPPFHRWNLENVSVQVGGKSVERGKLVAALDKNQFVVSDLGVFTFHESLRGKKVKISATYQPNRVAVLITADPSPSDLRDAIKKRLELWGDEVVAGAEVDATVEKIDKEGGDWPDVAKALQCSHIISGSTTSRMNFVHPRYYVAASVSLVGYDLLSGEKIVDREARSNSDCGLLRGWRGLRQDLVKDSAYVILDELVGGLK